MSTRIRERSVASRKEHDFSLKGISMAVGTQQVSRITPLDLHMVMG